jgi:putative inorganic carbon (HCO3(-)) transporter
MLALLLPVPLALLMFDGPRLQRHERVASGAAVLGLAAILVLTKSRGALLAAAFAALVLCLLRWRRSWVVMVLIALLAWFALWQVGFARVSDVLTTGGSLVGFSNRLEMWSRGVYLVRDFPLTGIGMGTFEPLAKARYPFVLLGPNADVPHAHNIFLQVAVDLGIPGLLAWLGLLFLAARNAWRVHLAGVRLAGLRLTGRRQGLGWAAGLGAGLLCSQVALVMHGMVDAAVWGAHSALVVWVLWGICAGAYNRRNTYRRN